MIIQIIVASLATVGAALIVMRNSISSFFKGKKRAGGVPNGEPIDTALEEESDTQKQEQGQKDSEK